MNLSLAASELERLYRDLESDRVERKESIKDKDKIARTICAFANDLSNHQQPGVIFVGQRDDGSCANLRVDDAFLQSLGAIRSDGNILPLPVISVQKQVIDGCEVAIILVAPSDAPPVRYKGTVWIRVGPRSEVASAQDERILNEKRRFKDLPYDLYPVNYATLDDLDIEWVRHEYLPNAISRTVIQQNERPIEHQLVSLRFVSPDMTPTVTGLLAAGRDPRRFLPSAYIQFVRFDGSTLTHAIKDQKELSGKLIEVLRQMDEVFKLHISSTSDISASIETPQPDYPLSALQQMIRNAVMHRNYEQTNAPVRVYWFDDRIEIDSPGGPYGSVTIDNFGTGVTDYRNPSIAEVMKNLGFAQRFGVGFSIANQALQQNGNPLLKTNVTATRILITIEKRQ